MLHYKTLHFGALMALGGFGVGMRRPDPCIIFSTYSATIRVSEGDLLYGTRDCPLGNPEWVAMTYSYNMRKEHTHMTAMGSQALWEAQAHWFPLGVAAPTRGLLPGKGGPCADPYEAWQLLWEVRWTP